MDDLCAEIYNYWAYLTDGKETYASSATVVCDEWMQRKLTKFIEIGFSWLTEFYDRQEPEKCLASKYVLDFNGNGYIN